MIDVTELVKKLIAAKDLGEQELRRVVDVIDSRINKTEEKSGEVGPSRGYQRIYSDEPIDYEKPRPYRNAPQQNNNKPSSVDRARSAPAKSPDDLYVDFSIDGASDARPVYKDTPIPKEAPGAAKPFYSSERAANDRIEEMRRIGRSYLSRSLSPAELFYKQAKFMEDFYCLPSTARIPGDRGGYEYNLYFSGYQSMSRHSLRSYFAWRSKLRCGKLEYAPLSYAILYATELINLIGADSPVEGYDKLTKFLSGYGRLDTRLGSFAGKWIKDFVICHGLDKSLLPELNEFKNPEQPALLLDPGESDDSALFDALNTFSQYKIAKSRLYKLDPEGFTKVCAMTYRRAVKQSREKAAAQKTANRGRKQLFGLGEGAPSRAFIEKYIGTEQRYQYDIFGSLLYRPAAEQPDRVYEVTPMIRYRLRNGKWYAERLMQAASNKAALGSLLRNVDFLMRRRCGIASTLKSDGLERGTEALINSVLDKYLKEKAEAERQEIRIDLTKLEGIRASAEETRDLLLAVPEEDEFEKLSPEETEPEPEEQITVIEPIIQPHENETNGIIFTEEERTLLNALLSGGDYENKLRQLGALPSIVADSVNEKLFDLLSDTAIIDGGEGLSIIEDYREDLKGILANGE